MAGDPETPAQKPAGARAAAPSSPCCKTLTKLDLPPKGRLRIYPQDRQGSQSCGNDPRRGRVEGFSMQTTLKQAATLVGTGLHSGRPARMTIRPAETGGIRFRRTDVQDRDNVIPARYDLVSDTTLCTVLTNASGVSISTVEHVMAALAGLGVHNALVEVDGPEVPIMDGSAQRFVAAILRAGLRRLQAPVEAIRILRRSSTSATVS
jgi:hypothetical protein